MDTTLAFQQGLLADVTATAATLDPVATFVGLYADGPTVNPPDTVADFTLPDATDMPAVAVTTWGAVQQLLDGRQCRQALAKIFRLPDATNAFVAKGWYLADALTGGNVLAWEDFPTPINMPDASRTITIIARVCAPITPDYSASAFIDG